MHLIHVCLVKGVWNLKLDRVITSSDRLDIPLDILVLFELLYVVDIIDDEHSKENSATDDHKAHLLDELLLCWVDQASKLHEKVRIIVVTLGSIKVWRVSHQIRLQVFKRARLFAMAVIDDCLPELVFIDIL